MTGFDVAPASLRTFASAAAAISDRGAGMRGVAASAELPSGAFTQTPGGRLADAAHAAVLNHVDKFINNLTNHLQAGIDAVQASATEYEHFEQDAARKLARIGDELGTTVEERA